MKSRGQRRNWRIRHLLLYYSY